MKVIDHISAICDIGGSIQSEESIFPHIHEVFKNVYHFGHLTEDKHFISIPILLLQNPIQLLQLRRVSYQVAKIDDLDIRQ